jgi:hypothetical protein
MCFFAHIHPCALERRLVAEQAGGRFQAIIRRHEQRLQALWIDNTPVC